MRREIKGFIKGCICMALLMSSILIASADSSQKMISVTYSNIKIYIEGRLIELKDSKGNKIEPFVSNGTTYLPVRAISEALGKNVEWDSKNNSISISQKPVQSNVSPISNEQSEGYQEITVNNALEFYNAIGPNRKILLKPGEYLLSDILKDIDKVKVDNYRYINPSGEVTIRNVSNLTIEGLGDKYVELKTNSRFNLILYFTNVDGLSLNNIRAGHIPTEYMCEAGVLQFRDSKNIKVSKSELYGCGAYGVSLYNVENAAFDNVVITHCSLYAMSMYKANNIYFNECKLLDNNTPDCLVYIRQSYDITYNNCVVSSNKIVREGGMMFDIWDSSKIKVGNSSITNNASDYFVAAASLVKVEDTSFENNKFDIGMYRISK